MIESLASDETQSLFATVTSRRSTPGIRKWAVIRRAQLHAAAEVDDLRMPLSQRLQA